MESNSGTRANGICWYENSHGNWTKEGDTKPWTPIVEPELMAFTGMKIAMGIGQRKETLSHGLQ